MTHQPPGPTSWRDVYNLVQDVEKRLTDRIDDANKVARDSAIDHEGRLRTMESVGTPVSIVAAATATALTLRVDALERVNEMRIDRRAGAVSVFSIGNKVVVGVVLIANATVALIALIMSNVKL